MFTLRGPAPGPPSATAGGAPRLVGVSTRRLIITALLCGMAILIAFAVQASQWS